MCSTDLCWLALEEIHCELNVLNIFKTLSYLCSSRTIVVSSTTARPAVRKSNLFALTF